MRIFYIYTNDIDYTDPIQMYSMGFFMKYVLKKNQIVFYHGFCNIIYMMNNIICSIMLSAGV